MHPSFEEPRPRGVARVVLPAGVCTCAVQTVPWVPPWGTAMGHGGLRAFIPEPCWVGPHLGWGLDRKR